MDMDGRTGEENEEILGSFLPSLNLTHSRTRWELEEWKGRPVGRTGTGRCTNVL